MGKLERIKAAVTGSIGSGKSTFCKLLEEKGYPVINVDDLSKRLLISDENIKSRIIKEFGEESYTGKVINKKFLADRVFSNPAGVIKINSIVHPSGKKNLKRKMDEILEGKDIVFAEAALIYEADMEEMFDCVVLVTADEKIRMARKTESDNLSKEQFVARNENQIPDEEKKKRADFVFENNGTLNELSVKVDLLIKILKGLLETKLSRRLTSE